MAKCILLFSGGLDSMLSAKILLNQKVEISPVCFESYFFGAARAMISAEYLGLKLEPVSFREDHLSLVKKPAFGYGKGMNPCIDCHLLMLKKAGEIMKKRNYDFLATGEVLDERPFSQNKRIMSVMEKEAGLEGLVLRPLSARVLEETIPEKKGWVDRKKLFDIRGKSRKSHLALAESLGVKEFPQPAGGCLLTDIEYVKKLRTLAEKAPGFGGPDCEMLKKGRVIWDDGFLFVAGRSERENENIDKSDAPRSAVIAPTNFPGPSVMVKTFSQPLPPSAVEKAKEIILKYSKKAPVKPEYRIKTQ